MIIQDTNKSSQQIFLNSKHATTTAQTGSSCRFHLQDLTAPDNTQIIVSVVDVIVPVSYYVINGGNNRLYYSDDGGSEYLLTIPVGNYNAQELANHLESFIHVLSSVSYSLIDNKMRFFSNTATFTFHGKSTCFDLLGLTANEEHPAQDNGMGIHVIVATSSVDLSGYHSVHVHSNIATTSLNSSSGSMRTLCRVPITAPRNSIVCYTPTAPIQTILNSKSIDFVDISLTDSDIRPIDFNGLTWSITLRVDYQFVKEDSRQPTSRRFDRI